jgi:hypothetical protein
LSSVPSLLGINGIKAIIIITLNDRFRIKKPSRGQMPVVGRTEAREPGTLGPVVGRTKNRGEQ